MNRIKLASLAAAAALAAGLPAHGQDFDADAYCERVAMLPAERRPLFGQTLCSNRAEIDQNKQSADAALAEQGAAIDGNGAAIADNEAAIDSNWAAIAENETAIADNGAAIAGNGSAIMQQGMMIEENRAMLDSQGMSIGNNMARLDGHDQMLANHADMIGGNAKAIRMVDDRVSKVAAMAAALSAVPNAPTSQGGFFVGVGVGNHDGQSGVAIGLSGCLGRPDVIFNAGVANSSGETTLRAGIGWSF